MATFDGLFDPAKVAEKRRLDSEKREALARIKAWAEELLPEPARGRLKVTVNEVVCGDPACAPIDTVVEFWGELRTGFGMPSRAAEVTQADLVSFLPDEDVLVAVGHLLNDAVDPLGAAAEFPQGKGDPMRLLRRLESIARGSAKRGSTNGNGNSNSNSAAHGAAGTANGDDPLRDLTEELFFSEAASAGAARDLTLAAGRGVVASARARLPRGTGMPFFPPFRK